MWKGKLFFSVLARRMTSFLSSNHYIDTSCQKAGFSGFPGCIEHTSVIWEQIQVPKERRVNFTWCGLTWRTRMAQYHISCVEFALEFFHVPACVITIIAKYFSNLRMFFSHDGRMTGWQQLEVGIAMGCSISPILFVAAFEIILIGARQMARGLRSPSGRKTPGTERVHG